MSDPAAALAATFRGSDLEEIAGKVLAVLSVLFLQVLVVTAAALFLGWQPEPEG